MRTEIDQSHRHYLPPITSEVKNPAQAFHLNCKPSSFNIKPTFAYIQPRIRKQRIGDKIALFDSCIKPNKPLENMLFGLNGVSELRSTLDKTNVPEHLQSKKKGWSTNHMASFQLEEHISTSSNTEKINIPVQRSTGNWNRSIPGKKLSETEQNHRTNQNLPQPLNILQTKSQNQRCSFEEPVSNTKIQTPQPFPGFLVRNFCSKHSSSTIECQEENKLKPTFDLNVQRSQILLAKKESHLCKMEPTEQEKISPDGEAQCRQPYQVAGSASRQANSTNQQFSEVPAASKTEAQLLCCSEKLFQTESKDQDGHSVEASYRILKSVNFQEVCSQQSMCPPVAQQSVPIAQQSVSVAQQSVPVAQQPVPVAQQSVPVAQQSVPVAQQFISVAQQPVPVAQQSVPTAQQSVPVAQQSVPVAQQSAPVAEQSVPVAQPSVPVAQKSVPQLEVQMENLKQALQVHRRQATRKLSSSMCFQRQVPFTCPKREMSRISRCKVFLEYLKNASTNNLVPSSSFGLKENSKINSSMWEVSPSVKELSFKFSKTEENQPQLFRSLSKKFHSDDLANKPQYLKSALSKNLLATNENWPSNDQEMRKSSKPLRMNTTTFSKEKALREDYHVLIPETIETELIEVAPFMSTMLQQTCQNIPMEPQKYNQPNILEIPIVQPGLTTLTFPQTELQLFEAVEHLGEEKIDRPMVTDSVAAWEDGTTVKIMEPELISPDNLKAKKRPVLNDNGLNKGLMVEMDRMSKITNRSSQHLKPKQNQLCTQYIANNKIGPEKSTVKDLQLDKKSTKKDLPKNITDPTSWPTEINGVFSKEVGYHPPTMTEEPYITTNKILHEVWDVTPIIYFHPEE